ncbi:hypothetical protein ACF0H5_008724 [Mactra antiquata]
MLKLCIFLAVPLVCYGFLFGRDQSDWNGLKVTWGVNPFSSFISQPRTVSDAQRGHWQETNPGAACDANPKFLGHRYIKDNDMGVILIYDANGYIAGIQLGFPRNFSPNTNNFPFAPLDGHPVITDGDNYFLTAYFVDPATVCAGRTAGQFASEGTGTGLWIQNGTDPVRDSITIPQRMSDADASKWTKGACFISMGVHYWYQISKGMNCDNFYPVFLLYNGGVLNGFGWAIGMDLKSYSSHIEHPPQSSYGNFMLETPDCLNAMGTLTTLHIYMTDSALADTC